MPDKRMEKAARKVIAETLWTDDFLSAALIRFAGDAVKKATAKARREAFKEAEAEIEDHNRRSSMPKDWHNGLEYARVRIRALSRKSPRKGVKGGKRGR